jgi:hypothetical protein
VVAGVIALCPPSSRVSEKFILTKLKEWCVEAAPNEWQRLLSSITGMQAGCGMPELSQLTKP